MTNPYEIGLARNPEPEEPMNTEEEEVIAECEECGEEIKADDESLAVIAADGKVKHWCSYCMERRHSDPVRFVTDMLEALGVYYVYDWADEADEACRTHAARMKVGV